MIDNEKVNYMVADYSHFERHHPHLARVIANASLRQINEMAVTQTAALGHSSPLLAQERALDLQFGFWARQQRGQE